ncbi:PX-SNX8-Mvp1p-like protein (macronuclear) [Tetrahymena thermophila SB210]|uniref:PX-SNX8-Mvp1p-like protein n=1 Tax=Tetrahymena thermophila (strain SB210) TaxID=312017 RepID=I7M2G7_TETTS|nr:PX-SNX8-Mvp1p-like protein [Tetrahymena thermophila SB210]EAS00357.2 PX-SNX8-Mvp1p-like protein [Tetrahymena thermophila SB210]|eukprot:XP_001020602.2 PX-SNX8-Mvp1p-like protein [Tetrahymena thermophila SB210]
MYQDDNNNNQYQDQYQSNYYDNTYQQNYGQQDYQQNQQTDQQNQQQNQNFDYNNVQRPDDSQRIFNPFILDDNNEIQISVGEPVTKETTLSKHTVYNIKGTDKIGQFDVYRRFNEFYTLKEVLVARWPGCFIPSIPAKEINSTSQNVVENRARFLNSFCNQMARLKHLFYSEEFQQFLRSKDSDVSKHLSTLKKVTTSDIIDKYQLTFPEICEQPLQSDLDIKINSWTGFLKRAIGGLKNYKDQLKTLTELRKELNKNFAQFNEEILPDYEKCLISEYVSNDNFALIFSNEANVGLHEFNEKFKNSKDKNSFQYLYDMVKYELRDAEAFEESIKEKEQLEKKRSSVQKDLKDDEEDLNKLISGKKTVKAIFSSSEEQKKKLETKIDQFKVELKNLDNLIEIVTKIIGMVEIDRFRKEKRMTFHRVLQCVADSEICNSMDLMQYWSQVNDSSTRLLKNY